MLTLDEAIANLNHIYGMVAPDIQRSLDVVIKALERTKGEWIEESSETGALGIKYTWVKCNQCGWSNSLVIPKNFCPNCGADMRGDEK